jgi:1-acyl-sn-glycerol-3-phosphate acyltransferase
VTVDEPLPLNFLGKWLARWLRYESDGFEQLVGAPTGLVVGYHGRPMSLDILLLGHRLHEETGRYPVAFMADIGRAIPVVRHYLSRIDAVFGKPDEAAVQRARAAGRHFLIAPGGLREALRPTWRARYTIDFGERRGYISFALEHGLPVYPVVATGVDEAYLNLFDGYALGRRVFGHSRFPLALSVGFGGLFPLALPFPVRVRQRIGAPIDVVALRDACLRDGRDPIETIHAEVTGTMQRMLDELRK